MLPNNWPTADDYGYAALAVAGTFLAVLPFARSNDHVPH